MTLTTRRIGVSHPAHLPLCERCKADPPERHNFLAHFRPEEGPSWERLIHAIGPFEAHFLASEHVAGELFDTSIFLQHAPDSEEAVLDVLAAPNDPDAVGMDPIDQWRAYRDAGYGGTPDTALADRGRDGDR